jgi:hypothetical protein
MCRETAIRLKLRDEPTLRGQDQSVVRDPERTFSMLDTILKTGQGIVIRPY